MALTAGLVGTIFDDLRQNANRVRYALDDRELTFYKPDLHPTTYQVLRRLTHKRIPATQDEVQKFLSRKAYVMGFLTPETPTKVWMLDPWDAEYLQVEMKDLMLASRLLKANDLIDLDDSAAYGSATDKLLQQMASPSPKEVDDREFARMAILEARKSVSENDDRVHPKVGAVVVKDGRVLSAAHGGEQPGNHAEFVALDKKLTDEAVAGATVYTTLEPCTTRNKPKIPCTERLIDRKVARVVIGMLDPDDRISGKGVRKLRQAGIATVLFPHDLAMEVEELNREFIRFCEQNVRAEVGPANMELWKEVAGLRTELAEFRQNVEARDKERAEFDHFPVNFSLTQGAPNNYIGLLKNDSKHTVVVETIQICRGDVNHESPLTEAVKPRPTDDWKIEAGTSKTLYWGPQYDPISMLKSLVKSSDPNFPNGSVIPIALVLMLNVEGKRFPKKCTQQVLMQGIQVTPWGP